VTTTTNPNKALWEKGDFTRVAESMRKSGEALVDRLGITPGMRALDLGSGDGTTALPEASGPRCWAWTSPATWSRLATAGPKPKA
jgi:cyclopropane fatty-acyl-phospholipid synthase-like methyltransferase